MKRLSILALAAALAPAAAFAQVPPPGGGGAPNALARPDRSGFAEARRSARAQMLDALTPAHRTLLASVAGALATSDAPDPRAAASQLDAALSPGEAQAIVAVATGLRDRMRAMAGAPPAPRNAPSGAPARTRTVDAGAALLRAAMAFGGPGRGGRGGPPPAGR